MKIVVGFDGSESAREAVNVAIERVKNFGGRLVVLSSMEKGTDNEQISKVTRSLEWAGNLGEDAGIDCQSQLLIRGFSPGEDIVKFAKDHDIDEIVVGIKRRSKVGKLLMGSTAQYVILNAHCPVLTVK